MTEVRFIDVKLDKRVETGPTQIGDDWPGLFIRGDNAMHYAFALRRALDGDYNDAFSKMALESLYKDLISSRVK